MTSRHFRWEELLDEYNRVRIGYLWLDLVAEVTEGVCRRYPGRTYGASSPSWSEADVDDLVQEVLLTRLLEAGQIEYVVTQASSVGSARGLIGMHVKQVLASRAIPNQAERVAARLWEQFQEQGAPAPSVAGAVAPPGVELQAITRDYPVQDAARILSSLPRLPNRGTERLSPVFSRKTLRHAVQLIWDEIPAPITRELVREICARALTVLVPSLFQLDEDDSARLRSATLTPEEETLLRDTVEGLLGVLNPTEREVVACAGIVKDTELAERLGVSRATVINHRRRISAKVVEAVRDLEPPLPDLVVLEMQDAIGVGT